MTTTTSCLIEMIIFDSLLNRDFNFIFFARINVTMDVNEGCLTRTTGKEAKVTKLVSRMRLILLMVYRWREKPFDSCLFDVYIVIVFDFVFMAA